jgi:two-component system CheB/CheR fusion protein
MAVRSVKKKTRPKGAPGAKASSGGVGAAERPGPIVPADRRTSFPVVGVGASAGGLEALEELFDHMPADTGMAFVIVTHQHPGHPSLLPELLAKETSMAVVAAAEGVKLEPNHVYVGPPGGLLSIVEGTLHRVDTGLKEAPRLPIEHFFRSLAEDQRERAIGIVLSGTGTDGTLGVKAVKGESGMAMVQKPQSAKYAGMPSSAIATGLADYVLPPAEMPSQLVAYARGPYLTGASVAAEAPVVPEEPMQRIFMLLRNRTGHDFSAYKSNTLRRRIERRMNLHQIKRPNEYVRHLQENPHEIDILFKERLIGVTSFFRDPDAWEALHPHLDHLIASRPENHVLRVWVPGCATGEEAFTMAILLRESMDRVERHLDAQIFGTDLDGEAIESARTGRYPDGIAVDVSPKRLERYFLRDDGAYRVRKEIREMVVFAPQNVIKDPPFTKLDVLSCRNLLIYRSAELQKRLLPVFHYALKPDGILFLGTSETIGSLIDLFHPLDKQFKIFRRKESVAALHRLPEIPAQLAIEPGEEELPAGGPSVAKESRVPTVIERLLLARFAPASAVVNARGDIVYIHGRTGAYLEPAPGQPRNNILEMAREGLQVELAEALRACVAKGGEVVREDVGVKAEAGLARISLSVARIRDPEAVRGLFLVAFRPAPPALLEQGKVSGRRKKTVDDQRVARLERTIRYMRESHQTTLEELETSNEELKSTNEELESTNEELQSTNEELETSKEEMQSLNEELTTVNAELQSKVDELSQANDDMQNLLNSTDIATLFLDNDLNIKRFTEEAKAVVTVRKTDIGRPIGELASNLVSEGLDSDCREVLRTLVFKQSQVRTLNGKWFLMRIMPYRTAENVIDGLVLTFVNITQVKQAGEAGEKARLYFESIFDTLREPLLVLDRGLKVVSANRSFYRAFRTTARQTEGESIFELAAGRWDIPKLRTLLEEILPKNSAFEDYEVEVEIPKFGRRVFVLNARRLQVDSGGDQILLALEDMTSAG